MHGMSLLGCSLLTCRALVTEGVELRRDGRHVREVRRKHRIIRVTIQFLLLRQHLRLLALALGLLHICFPLVL